MQRILDSMTTTPAYVRNGRLDILAADEGLRISAYTAEPGCTSEDALNLLASWAATVDQAGSAASQPGQAR